MSRVIIEVGPDRDDELSFRLLRGPRPPLDRKPRRFTCRSADMPAGIPAPAAAGWIGEYGKRLWDGLADHPEVHSALRYAIGQPPGDPQTIMFELQDQRAELFNWEMLCDDTGRFLALDERWPIGRIAEAGVDRAGAVPEFFTPLRIMAVLSALGASADEEWDNLYASARDARAAGLPVNLRVLVGEAPLLARVEEQAAADPALSVAPVTDSAGDVLSAIRDAKPHILHFFCHGTAEQGQPRLLLATPQDFDRGRVRLPSSPTVRLHVALLQELLPTIRTWLVVLNCCEGGKAAQDVHSLAHSLATAGVPAAIGMREAVPVRAAREFSRVFYRELLTEFVSILTPPAGAPVEKDVGWARVLAAPRAALVERYEHDATTYREWTLPVLYTGFDPFRVRVMPSRPPATATAPVEPAPPRAGAPGSQPPDGAAPVPPAPPPAVTRGPTEERVIAAILEGLLRRLPQDAPPAMIEGLRALADAQLAGPAESML